jgi:hypothetical protein
MKLLATLATFLLSFANLRPPLQASSSPQVVQRDAQALAVLTQCLKAIGGTTAVASVQDFTGTGTITYYWGGQDVPGSVTVYGTNSNQFRLDATLSGGVQSFIVNGNAGTLLPLNGQKLNLSYYSVMTAGTLTFPFPRIATALNDSSTTLNYVGLVARNNSQAYEVHVTPPLDPLLQLDSRLKGLGEFDLYFDPTSYRLVEVAEIIWWGGDLTQTYSHEILFSNYVSSAGLSVPLGISEKFGGQETWSVTLTSLIFNNGLSQTLFTL